MLDLARANAAKAGAGNVEFLKGTIEDIPLPDASVDVVISNCVINLSTDKPAVLAEMFRVLTPGGRLGISDVVAEDHLTPAERAERGSYVGCIAGALSRTEYLDGLAAAGFIDAEVDVHPRGGPGMHGAIVRATKPSTSADVTDAENAHPASAASTLRLARAAGRLQVVGSLLLAAVVVGSGIAAQRLSPDRRRPAAGRERRGHSARVRRSS